MSVIQVNGGKGILGTLGTLASLGGAAFGVPMLTTLGTGMTGIDTLMNGGGQCRHNDADRRSFRRPDKNTNRMEEADRR